MDSSIFVSGHVHCCQLGFLLKINRLANSIDPDEMVIMSHLIWIYTVCIGNCTVYRVERIKGETCAHKTSFEPLQQFYHRLLQDSISVEVPLHFFVCSFVLRFYGPVNPMGSCQAWSVYLTTLLLVRYSPLSG